MLKDRIKLVRSNLPGKITQEQFARMIGTTRPAIASYETGAIIPKEHILKLICKEFQINETWLKDGIGEMHAYNDNNCLDEMKVISNLPADCQTLLNYYLAMELPFQHILLSIAKELKNNDIQKLYLHCRAPQLNDSDRKDILIKMQDYEAKLIAEKEASLHKK